MFDLELDEKVAERVFLGLKGLDENTQSQAKKQFVSSFVKSRRLVSAKIKAAKLCKKMNTLETLAQNYLEYIYDTLRPTFPDPLKRAQAYGECFGIFFPMINQLFTDKAFYPESRFNDVTRNYHTYGEVILGLIANIIGKLKQRGFLDGTIMFKVIRRCYQKHEKDLNPAKKTFFANLELEFKALEIRS